MAVSITSNGVSSIRLRFSPGGPAGAKGDKGDPGDPGAPGVGSPGPAGTVAVGATTTGAPGSAANVANTGTLSAAILSFTIPQGLAGAAGAAGPQGRVSGLQYAWDTGTAASDPGAGKLRVNSSSLTGATELYISETDGLGVAIAQWLANWSASTSPNRGTVYIFNPDAPTNYTRFNIVGPLADNGAWDTIPVVHVDHAGTLTNGMTVAVQFSRTGDMGAAGAAATIAVGTTTTGLPGSSAAVSNTGTSSAAVLAFTIPQGNQGNIGPPPALTWTFDPTLTDADPGNGNIRFNAATYSAATFLYFDNLESGGSSAAAWLDALDDSTNVSNKGRLFIFPVDGSAKYASFVVTGAVTDGGGYRKVPVSFLASNGTFTTGSRVAVEFAPAGNKGADGGGGGNVFGNSGTDSHFAFFDVDQFHLKDGGIPGALATKSTINGGDWSGTDLAVADGGTGSSTASAARTALGLEIGVNVQAFDAELAALAGLTSAADKVAYFTGAGTAAVTDLNALGRSIIGAASTAAVRTAIGAAIGSDVQAYDAELAALAGLASAADKVPYFTGSGTAALADLSAYGRTLIDDANAAAARTTLGLGGLAVKTLVTPSDLDRAVLLEHGRCRLALSAGNLVLSPKDGNIIIINNKVCTIPSAGVSLAATGLTPGTGYYIYARDADDDGVVDTLEASTTAYAISATNGVATKSGDATRTLVGWGRPVTGPAWVDTSAQRLVRSYFNRLGVETSNAYTTVPTTVSTSFVEISTSIRNEVFLWADESWTLIGSGNTSNSSVTLTLAGVGIDGAIPVDGASGGISSTATFAVCATCAGRVTPGNEGYHYATIMGKVGAGTGSYGSSADSPTRFFSLQGSVNK